jgi:hypothetical protein
MKRSASILALLMLAACSSSSTDITDVVREPGTERFNFQRVAAIAIARDPALRRQAEDEMARQLGTKGVASYSVLTDEDLKNVDTVRSKLQSNNFDGAVTMEILSLDEERIDPRGSIPDPYQAFGASGGVDRGIASDWEEVARVETQIFSVASGKLLWSAATKTFTPGQDPKQVVANVAKVIAKELRSTGLVN